MVHIKSINEEIKLDSQLDLVIQELAERDEYACTLAACVGDVTGI